MLTKVNVIGKNERNKIKLLLLLLIFLNFLEKHKISLKNQI